MSKLKWDMSPALSASLPILGSQGKISVPLRVVSSSCRKKELFDRMVAGAIRYLCPVIVIGRMVAVQSHGFVARCLDVHRAVSWLGSRGPMEGRPDKLQWESKVR